MTAIDPLISADMLEATRLTREGQLADATALIQRLFHDKRNPGKTSGARVGSAGTGTSSPPVRHASRGFDVDPTTGAVTNMDGMPGGSGSDTQLAPTAIQQAPEKLRGFLDQISQRARMQKLDLPGRPVGCTSVPLPDGARFETAVYADAVGRRAYKLYVPSSQRGGQPVPLVVMLHGCTQSPDDFAAGTRMNTLAEEQNFLVAFPTQPASANAQMCWNWFTPGDQERGCGEPALIAGITRQVMRDYPVDPACVYVAGFSAGGAAAAIMAEAYPDLYAAVGGHSGLACGSASDLPSAFTAMRQGGAGTRRRTSGGPMLREAHRTVPTIVFHGDRDTTVHPRNGAYVLAQVGATAGDLRTTVEHGQLPNGGRTFTRTLHANDRGMPVLEQWIVHGEGHAWSGGSSEASYTDPRGPDASREMLRFFLDHPHAAPQA